MLTRHTEKYFLKKAFHLEADLTDFYQYQRTYKYQVST